MGNRSNHPSAPRYGRLSALLALLALALLTNAAGASQTTPLQLPGPPRLLTYRLTSDRVILDWLPPLTGGPVSSYQIIGGAGPGRRNYANFDTFQNATRINLKVGEGEYYVRVAARNAAGISTSSSNEIFFPVTGNPSIPNPVFVEPTINITQDFFGDVLVLGEVQNRALGGGAPNFIEIDAIFISPGGNIVGTNSTFLEGRSRRLRNSGNVTDTALLPGQRGCFIMSTNIPASQVSLVLLGGSFDTFSNDPLSGRLQVAQYTQQADFFGDLQMLGTATNVGTRPTYFNRIVFDVKTPMVQDCDSTFVDGVNMLLPSGVTTSTGLFPGQTGTFTNFTNVPFGPLEVRRYTQWDEAAPAGAHQAVEARRKTDPKVDAILQRLESNRSLLRQLVGGPGTPSRASLNHLRDEIESGLRELEARMAPPDASLRLPFENRLSRPLARR
jgi:hypothetical protein